MTLLPYLLVQQVTDTALMQRLAKSYNLQIIDHANSSDLASNTDRSDLLLSLEDNRLQLVELVNKKISAKLAVDFNSPTLKRRINDKANINSELARAIGVNKHGQLAVLDATAGFGRDSFVLASLGCFVTALERAPVVFELFVNGLKRASAQAASSRLSEHLQIHQLDFLKLEKTSQSYKELYHDQAPQVIYLDPMFPARTKSALVKKESRWLKELVGEDPDADQLLLHALKFGAKRVVVKRPKAAGFLANQKPTHTINGKSVRFDVYIA